jgi:hypothetical protein
MRQLNPKGTMENLNHDAVENHEYRRRHADGDDHTDHQKERNAGDRKDIPVGHPDTMRAFAQGRQN